MRPLKLDDAWTGKDKREHFAGGAAISAVAAVVVMLLGAAPAHALLIGFLVCSMVAWAKEGWDSATVDRQPSLQDALVTQAGGLVSAGAAYGVLLFLRLV